ncbi:MAG: ferredoxin--NADP reductase [Myxococcota bacterium]
MNAKIVERHDLSEDLAVWRVKPVERAVRFIPGQYMSFGIPTKGGRLGDEVPVIVRPYSVSSSPSQTDYFEFLIRRVSDGEATPRLWDLSVGDALWIRESAKGDFTVDLAEPKKRLLILATGTGLGPFMSMIRYLNERGELPPVTVVHGVRSTSELVYFNELNYLEKSRPGFVYCSCVSREASPIRGHTMVEGRITNLLRSQDFIRATGHHLEPEHTTAMLCGNPDMIADSVDELERRGFSVHTKNQRGNVHFERYW